MNKQKVIMEDRRYYLQYLSTWIYKKWTLNKLVILLYYRYVKKKYYTSKTVKSQEKW